MKTAHVPFNALPQNVRKKLVSLCKSRVSDGHYILLDKGDRSTTRLPSMRRNASMWGGLVALFLGLGVGIAGLVIIVQSKAHWPIVGMALLPFGALLFGVGLTLWSYGYKNITVIHAPYTHHEFLFPLYRIQMNIPDVVVSSPDIKYTVTKTTITKKKNRRKVGEFVAWSVKRTGSFLPAYNASSEEGARAYATQQTANRKALFDKMQTAIVRGDQHAIALLDPLGKATRLPEWPNLPAPLETTEPKTTVKPSSARSGLMTGAAIACLVFCLAVAASLGSGYLSERKAFDDIKSTPTADNCLYYLEKDGFLLKNDLKKTCAKALWKGALSNIEDRKGYEARKMLSTLERNFPHKKYMKKAKKKIKLVKECTIQYVDCP